jgi:hypothetical protein
MKRNRYRVARRSHYRFHPASLRLAQDSLLISEPRLGRSDETIPPEVRWMGTTISYAGWAHREPMRAQSHSGLPCLRASLLRRNGFLCATNG